MDPATMSIQQVNPYQQQQQRAGSQQQEDCRDYLRTGRCKYGASCKYNHPSNVQTGGGLKGPIDPTEPMFPVRPNEPVCQYYMKHGTCKFGQACKFHHPPQSAMTATLVTGGTVVMNVGRGGDQGHQVLLNAVATDAGGSSMMLQFLPQRPDEPDCIYFLRNGRCKYGATCRYHHPVNYARKSRDEGGGVRRSPMKGPVESGSSPQFQFVMASPSYPPSPFQQSQNASGSHVVLADGPVTFVTLDGSSIAEHSFRSLAMQQNSDLAATHGAPVGSSFGLGMQQEQNSSSSSMSSSYETAGSSMGDSGSALWNARRSGSGNSLNAYVLETSAHGHNHVPGSGGNDVSLSRRNRASSPGSDASGVYFDTATSMSWASGPAGPNPGVYGAGPSWRSRRSSSFDQTRQVPQNPYAGRSDMMPRSTSVPEALAEHGHVGLSPVPTRRPPVHATRQHRGFPTSDNTDEGLSMMTSALLNMIDTPEDSTNGFGVYEDDVTEGSLPEPTTPRSGSSFRAYSNYAKHHSAPQLPPDENMRASNLPAGSHSSGFYGHHEDPRYAQSNFTVRQRMPNLPYREQPSHTGKSDDYSWSPSWQGSLAVGRQMEEKAQSLAAIQPSIGPNPTPGAANVGLFLS